MFTFTVTNWASSDEIEICWHGAEYSVWSAAFEPLIRGPYSGGNFRGKLSFMAP